MANRRYKRLSDTTFRLSQHPPTSQRTRKGSRTESIEDDEVTGHLAASETRELLPESIETASEKYNSESVDSFGSQMSPSSSFVSMGTPPSSIRLKVGASAALQHTPPARVPLSAGPGRVFSTPPQQNRGMPAMTPLSQWSSLTPSQPTSTWRPVTLALHSSLLTPKSAPERRTLTSQRPAAVPQTASILRLHDLPESSGEEVQTPTKRIRRDTRAMAKMQSVVGLCNSEFCMWWHRLTSEDGMSALLGQRPQAELRVRVGWTQVLMPHLVCAGAEVLECRDGRVAQGQRIHVLLSFAVCSDAVPQVGARMLARLKGLAADPEDVLADEYVDVAVFAPWTVEGSGARQSLFASRFQVMA
ncbi:hypothetical protein EC988_001046 [Linderina pennispora]|nr:hypothetical protein EC988_001046 [Linderina pennispora]